MANKVEYHDAGIESAFRDYEQEVRISNYRVVSMLALIFMPAGAVLDWFSIENPDKLGYFFVLRLLCSFLLFIVWWIVTTPFGRRHLWLVGQIMPSLPSFFISIMIYETLGGDSRYYAGINLVLLGIGMVLRWTLLDSICVCVTAIGMYLVACFSCKNVPIEAAWESGAFFNNLYFLIVTAVFVIIGNYFYNRIRYREFKFRWELDNNRRELELTNKKLLEMDEIKSRFFANISHELRTPLTLLLAPLETLLHRFKNSVDEETRNILLTMQANGMRLLKLINDLLDLVRLESGRMEVKSEPVSIPEMVRGLASAGRQIADDKKVALESEVGPSVGTVLADRDKLEKVVLNLMFNALKFTPSGGRVAIGVDRKEERLLITVADTGMGISEKNLPFIFDRFWQADGSSSRRYQGVGIGLALVKELTELQGGRVTVQSKENVGTTFEIDLPYTSAEHADESDKGEEETPNASRTVSSEEWLANLYRRAELFPALAGSTNSSASPAPNGNGNGHPTVLVADDEPDMLRYLSTQLSAKYSVHEARNGAEAVEKAMQFTPDVILLDMMMPEKDGIQACKEIRENSSTRSTPVLLLTARADEETKMAALSAGANDFLAKPFSGTELFVRIGNLVQSHLVQKQVALQNTALANTIEQLKDTETQLVQSEKLASLGRMSAGLIHEINNPLNYAATGLFTLRKKASQLPATEQEQYNDILRDVQEGIDRVKSIVTDLRTFTRPDTESVEFVDLGVAVASALRFTSGEWRNKVAILQEVADGLCIRANKNKLIQVLVNLLQNSLDALKSKTFPDGEQAAIRVETRQDHDKTLLIVRDNGTGISAEHQDKIFDPFFTTKDVGEGMGLGLAISYRIVQQFDGRIRMRSEPGQFCEFTLEFPSLRASTSS